MERDARQSLELTGGIFRRDWNDSFPTSIWLTNASMLLALDALSGTFWSGLLDVLVATCVWTCGTRWFFGAGILPRLLMASGGRCGIVTPPSPLPPGKQFWNWIPLTSSESPKTPDFQLFTLYACLYPPSMSSNPQTSPLSSKDQKDPPSLASPRFVGGLDPSIPIFTLTLTILVTSRRLRAVQSSFQQVPRGGAMPRHLLAMGIGMICLCDYFTFNASLRYHTLPEKFLGFGK